jgi:hypothetical protein
MKVQDLTFCLEAADAFFKSALNPSVQLLPGSIEFQSLVFSEITALTPVSGFADGFFYLTGSKDFFIQLWRANDPTPDSVPPSMEGFVEQAIRQIGNRLTQLTNEANLGTIRVFTTIPDDLIEMPPATYSAVIDWQGDLAYFALGFNESALS